MATGFRFDGIVNAAYFSEAANDFKKNKGKYCLAPPGSPEFVSYWREQEHRCQKGHTVGGEWIPGRYYFNLNFTPMWRKPTKDELSRNIVSASTPKIQDFPRFTELHYVWWHFKHIAWNGGTFCGVTSKGNKHTVVAKTRRAGFSYNEACDGTYNYNFIPGSKTFFIASALPFLEGDGILPKVYDNLEWLNTHTDGWWTKNRHVKDVMLHRRASYLDAEGKERGYKSQIMGRVVDDPNKTRGIDGRKISLEESGSFPKLKTCLSMILPSVKDSGVYTGQLGVWGTGGEEGPSIQGLEELFYDPESMDFMAFPNVWDEESENDTCGFFVPSTMIHWDLYDNTGKLDKEAAYQREMEERAKKMKSTNPRDLDQYQAEFPLFTNESFKRLSKNKFDVGAIDRQIKRIKFNKAIQDNLRHGMLVESNGKIELDMTKDITPINYYPHKPNDNLEGCVTILEEPYTDKTSEKTPDDMYDIVVDPFYNDTAEDTTSLMAVYVIKQPNKFDNGFNRLPIAWYVARPADLNVGYEQLFLLSKKYNAKIQSEIAGGGKGIIDYARAKFLTHLLHFSPDSMNTKEVNVTKNRSLFMNTTTDSKNLGLSYLVDWHKELRGIDEDGNPTYIINYIYDLGLLEEMRKFNPAKGNFDRISALITAMFMLKQLAITNASRTQEGKEKSFYSRQLYGDYDNQESNIITSW